METGWHVQFRIIIRPWPRYRSKLQVCTTLVLESGTPSAGVRQDANHAREWYKAAAEAGDTDAMNNLGSMYEYGKGVKPNYRAARNWYKKAAELGNTRARDNLSRIKRDRRHSVASA